MKEFTVKVTSITTLTVEAESEDEAIDKACAKVHDFSGSLPSQLIRFGGPVTCELAEVFQVIGTQDHGFQLLDELLCLIPCDFGGGQRCLRENGSWVRTL